MFRRLTLSATLGALILTASSCAEEAPKEEAPAPVAADTAPKVEGPYYELTKDEITSHPDWTSMNITFRGAKLGDKGAAIEKALGVGERSDPIGDHQRTMFEKNKFAIYTAQDDGGAPEDRNLQGHGRPDRRPTTQEVTQRRRSGLHA